jgi:hypothetical protein
MFRRYAIVSSADQRDAMETISPETGSMSVIAC